MSYLEELLPEFRRGAKIRRKGVPQPLNAKGYIFYNEGKIYNEFGKEVEPDLGLWLSKNDWEFYQEPIDWDHIIKNKRLCAFWNKKGCEVLGFLKQIRYYKDNDFYTYISLPGAIYTGCRPVRRDEVNFYEDVKDE